MRTFVVEIGTGADLHGGDATKAAIRAVDDCFAHVSLPGLFSVAGLRDMSLMEVDVVLGVPEGLPAVDVEQVAKAFPFGKVVVKVEPGGLKVDGGGRPGDFIIM